MLVICLAVFIYSAIQLFLILRNYYVIDKLQDDTVAEYVTNETTTGSTSANMRVMTPFAVNNTTVTNSTNTTEDDAVPDPGIDVDLAGLQKVNKDIKAWIYIPDTKINYPVLQGTDNAYYLTHTHLKAYHVLGSIFMDYRNAADLTDSNTVIYGHNGKNMAMFGGLKKFQDQSYADARPYIYLIIADKTYVYKIFSAHVVKATSATYTRTFSSTEQYQKWLDTEAKASYITAAYAPTSDMYTLTLSTCTSVVKDDRFVLQGALYATIERGE